VEITIIDLDESLNQDLQGTWYKIAQEIKEVTEFVMPCQYFPALEFAAEEMHIFADAMQSQSIYADFVEGETTSLIMPKTKVAHLKNNSLP